MAEFGIVSSGGSSVDKLGWWLLGAVVLCGASYSIGRADGSYKPVAGKYRYRYRFGNYARSAKKVGS